MKGITLFLAILLATTGLLWMGAMHRTIYSKQTDPTGNYTAICSYRTYLTLLPMAPGSSSDKPCFVKIVDKAGENYGEIPVPMIQDAQVEWRTDGADIKLVGEWDFARKTCYFWSEDESHKIYVRK